MQLSFTIRGCRPNKVQAVGERESRDKLRERSRSRERDSTKRITRSRSPRRDRDRQQAKALKPEEHITESRTATPPVSFKVHGARASSQDAAGGQDHDRMDVDGDADVKVKRKKASKAKVKKVDEEIEEDDDEVVIEDDSMAAMQAMMGFGGFGSTHQQKVAGNDVYAVRKEKKTEYRQYMNRVGGFNRPLSPTRDG